MEEVFTLTPSTGAGGVEWIRRRTRAMVGITVAGRFRSRGTAPRRVAWRLPRRVGGSRRTRAGWTVVEVSHWKTSHGGIVHARAFHRRRRRRVDQAENPVYGWDHRGRAVPLPGDRTAMGCPAVALAGRRIPEDPCRLDCYKSGSLEIEFWFVVLAGK